jgi:UPF0716 family protein affecting phage T7 exclusion
VLIVVPGFVTAAIRLFLLVPPVAPRWCWRGATAVNSGIIATHGPRIVDTNGGASRRVMAAAWSTRTLTVQQTLRARP